MKHAIQVWGHRGCRGPLNPPENSVDAFESALRQDADGFELDVFLSRDNVPVVFHDDRLERMSNGTGPIDDCSLAQLKQLRLKDAHGRPTAATIPTLDEAFDVVDRFRREQPAARRTREFVVNVEIKERPGKDIASVVARSLADRLASGWSPHQFQVSSFDASSLRRMQELMPGIPRGALLHGGREPWDISPAQIAAQLAAAEGLKPRTVNITLPSINPESARIIREAGAEIVAWTCGEVNPDALSADERRAVAGTLWGNRVWAIITDYPRQMRALLNEHSSSGKNGPSP